MMLLKVAVPAFFLATSLTSCGEDDTSKGARSKDVPRLAYVAERCRVQDYDASLWDGTTLKARHFSDYWPCVSNSLGIKQQPWIDASNNERPQSGSFTTKGLDVNWMLAQEGEQMFGSPIAISDAEGLTWAEHEAEYAN